jgi:hypothetical protein
VFFFLCFGAPYRASIFFVGCSVPIDFLRAPPRFSSVCLLCVPPELFFAHCGSRPRLLFPLDFCCVFVFPLVDSIIRAGSRSPHALLALSFACLHQSFIFSSRSQCRWVPWSAWAARFPARETILLLQPLLKVRAQGFPFHFGLRRSGVWTRCSPLGLVSHWHVSFSTGVSIQARAFVRCCQVSLVGLLTLHSCSRFGWYRSLLCSCVDLIHCLFDLSLSIACECL